jgi:ADP-ribose pyrophosphatase YjhB (NUDIX family)
VGDATQAEPNLPEQRRQLVPAVGAVVVDAQGRVLLVRRAHPPSAGAWSLPGGRLEAGETLEAAVGREVLEETAIPARVVCSLGVVNVEREGFAYSIHEYLLVPACSDCPEPRASDDVSDARWATPADLAQLGLERDTLTIIERGLAAAGHRL